MSPGSHMSLKSVALVAITRINVSPGGNFGVAANATL